MLLLLELATYSGLLPGNAAVAVIVIGLSCRPGAVAWSVFAPKAEPSVQFTFAVPVGSVSVVTEPTPSLDPPPLLTVNVTATLGAPVPFRPTTRTVGSTGSVEPGPAR